MYTNVDKVAIPVFRPRLHQREKGGCIALLKTLLTWFTPLFMLLRSAPSRQMTNKPLSDYTDEYFLYPIDKQQFKSSVTRIFLSRNKTTDERICLKVWQTSTDDFNLYRANSPELRNRYVYEGLHRNRRFVKDVYLGIAPIIVNERDIRQRYVRLGQLIEDPAEKDIKPGVEYALVMRYLEEDWRLDYQLRQGGLNTRTDMKFLAQEIVKIHNKQSALSTKHKGTPDDILAKLDLNLQMLQKVLSYPEANQLTHYQEYHDMMEVIRSAGKKYKELFELRQKEGHVRYCHGDLKTANLWVQTWLEAQSDTGFRRRRRLYVLDCVDFDRPEFCYIDTLSDIAMLAIDIQMYITNWSDLEKDKGRTLVRLFLDTYLRNAEEKTDVAWLLLEYYLTEKAIVFACMSVLYDNLPTSVAEKYLDIGLSYMQKLKRRLHSSGKLSSNKKELSTV